MPGEFMLDGVKHAWSHEALSSVDMHVVLVCVLPVNYKVFVSKMSVTK